MASKVRQRKKTSFKVPESLQVIEQMILDNTDIPQAVHHRRAYDKFLNGDRMVMDRLLITNRKDPGYVKKNALEQTYIYVDQYDEFQKIAEIYHCNNTTLYFQALLNYYSELFQELNLKI